MLANLQYLPLVTIVNLEVWLGKILANDDGFAKFAKVFPRQSFALYGNTSHHGYITLLT